MTWNCRIIYHDKDKYPWFGVHEVFYDQNGNIYAYTIEAMDLTGETEQELKDYIDMIQKDVNRAPILIQSEIVLPEDDEPYEYDGKTFSTVEELIADLHDNETEE